jgi:hypothetical protein
MTDEGTDIVVSTTVPTWAKPGYVHAHNKPLTAESLRALAQIQDDIYFARAETQVFAERLLARHAELVGVIREFHAGMTSNDWTLTGQDKLLDRLLELAELS